jgi:MoxR-like ATPase
MDDVIIGKIQAFGIKVKENVEKVIVGKGDVVELVILALLCEGHVLIEDIPGVGKTVAGLQLSPHPVHAGFIAFGYHRHLYL